MTSKLQTLLLALLLAGCAGEQGNIYKIIPQPQQLTEKSGQFVVNRHTIISVVAAADTGYLRVAGFLAERFQTAAGFALNVEKNSSTERNIIVLKQVPGLEKEAYRLRISPEKMLIESSTPNGAFYAMQTLFQLLPPEIFAQQKVSSATWIVPCIEVADAPRFPYRGLHLDVCCHFFSVEFIKRYIDLIAMHKLNVFHWHLTEDQGWRIEIKRYPELTQKGAVRKETVIGTEKSNVYDGTPYGGFYTQDDIREVVRYAADRFITVIPEIEMPGHALAAIACFPNLSCGLEPKYEVSTRWGVYRQVYCPKPETFEFLENVLDEVMELFPSEYLHIGGDECPKTSWKQCQSCQKLMAKLGLKDELELQSYFVQRIEKFVNLRGRKIIGWDEILQGGLAPNATVMSWLGEEGGIRSAQQHHDVVMCPHSKYYLDYYQADPRTEKLCMGHWVSLREMYDYNPVPDTLTDEEARYIRGVQGCVWTEYMPDAARVEYMAFPRTAAICEAGWSAAKSKNWDSFVRRLEAHLVRLDRLNVGYCRNFFDVNIRLRKDNEFSTVVKLETDVPDAEIRYTIDGSAPCLQSLRYEIPFTINPSETVRAAAFRGGKQLGNETKNIR
jgi:hexosaminidase